MIFVDVGFDFDVEKCKVMCVDFCLVVLGNVKLSVDFVFKCE